MNPDIYAILERMKEQENFGAGDRQSIMQEKLSINMASLLVRLAEEAERQGKELAEQTGTIIKLTKALRAFTVVLVAIGAFQIVLMLKSLFH